MDRSPRDNYNYYTGKLNIHEEPYGYDEIEIFCPACSADLPEELGTLGNTTYYRCLDCGMIFTGE